MISRSHTEEEHLDHLHKLFERLKKYKMRLNRNKFTFGVRSGKLLGFVVSRKGIEVDPAKVKVIQEMPTPCTNKEVRGFLGRLCCTIIFSPKIPSSYHVDSFTTRSH